MANVNAPKIEYFRSFSDELLSKFQRLKSLVGHPVASGDYHEEILRSVFRNFLSKRFSVKKGFIFGGQGHVSRQIDILIIDESTPTAYIFQDGDFAIVMPEAVVAAIEVKSCLGAKEFDAALENIASVKRLAEYPTNVTGIVFGFDGSSPSDKVLNNWFKGKSALALKDLPQYAPDAFLFLTSKSLLVRCNENHQIGPDGRYYHRILDAQGDSDNAFYLSVILALVINACENRQFSSEYILGKSKAFSLVQVERGRMSIERFTLGGGKDEG